MEKPTVSDLFALAKSGDKVGAQAAYNQLVEAAKTEPDEVRVSPDGTVKFYRKRKRIYPSEEWLNANLGKK